MAAVRVAALIGVFLESMAPGPCSAAAHPSQVYGPLVGLGEDRMAMLVSPLVRLQVEAVRMPTAVEPEAHLGKAKMGEGMVQLWSLGRGWCSCGV